MSDEQTRPGENPMVEKVSGYRKLSQGELDLVNRIKAVGNEHIATLLHEMDGPVSGPDGAFFPDPRLRAAAKTQFEVAFALLIKSVAKPETLF